MLYMQFPDSTDQHVDPSAPAGEKRRHGRLRCYLLETNLGPVYDISASGVRIIAKKNLHLLKGESCTLRFINVPGELEVEARVIRAARVRMWQYELALEFVNLTPGQSTAIRTVAQASAKWLADRTGTA